MKEKTYLLRMTEEEHKKLMGIAKRARQSVSQYVLSKTIDVEKNTELEAEIAELKEKLTNRDSIPQNAKTGITYIDALIPRNLGTKSLIHTLM